LTKLKNTNLDFIFFSSDTYKLQDFIATRMMNSQLQACTNYVSIVTNDSSWMDFLQFVLSILIFAILHWIVQHNFEVLYSWIHPHMTGMRTYFTSTQNTTESKCGGSYGMKDGRLVFLPFNQSNVIQQQQSKERLSDSDDTSHDSSVITTGSTILTHLEIQKMNSRFSWFLKGWKRTIDVKKDSNMNFQRISRQRYCRYRRIDDTSSSPSSSPLKCDPSRRMKHRNIRSRHQYQRRPATIRNRIENAVDRISLWYYVDRRLSKSR
jgi:hypothetical protein